VLRIAFAVSLLAACSSTQTGEPEQEATAVAYQPNSALTSTNVQEALDEVSATASEARDRAVYIKGPTDIDPAVAKDLDAQLPANGRYSIHADGVLVNPELSGKNGKCTLYVEGQTGWAATTYFTLSGATPIHMTTVLDAAGNEAYMRWGCETDGKPLYIRNATLTAIEVGNVVHL
jgi:hypothetical protein